MGVQTWTFPPIISDLNSFLKLPGENGINLLGSVENMIFFQDFLKITRWAPSPVIRASVTKDKLRVVP